MHQSKFIFAYFSFFFVLSMFDFWFLFCFFFWLCFGFFDGNFRFGASSILEIYSEFDSTYVGWIAEGFNPSEYVFFQPEFIQLISFPQGIFVVFFVVKE